MLNEIFLNSSNFGCQIKINCFCEHNNKKHIKIERLIEQHEGQGVCDDDRSMFSSGINLIMLGVYPSLHAAQDSISMRVIAKVHHIIWA